MANPEGNPYNIGNCNEYGRNTSKPRVVDHDFGWPSSTPERAETAPLTTPVPQEQAGQSQQ